MKAEEFVIWLDGVFATIGDAQLTKKQSEIIKKMLAKVIIAECDEQYDESVDMPSFSIWEASSTAHSSVNKILVEYIEY
jgi:hypothetical protein